MDTAKRIAAAREKLDSLKKQEMEAKQAGPPCSTCIHVAETTIDFPRRTVPACGHLVYTRRGFSAATGRFDEKPAVLTEDARSQDGLCGPEGIFHEVPANPAWLRLLRNWAAPVLIVGDFAYIYFQYGRHLHQ